MCIRNRMHPVPCLFALLCAFLRALIYSLNKLKFVIMSFVSVRVYPSLLTHSTHKNTLLQI